MTDEIIINVTAHETRVAVIEKGIVQEVHVERASKRGIVGNIYKGRVVRILPGMQSAFIDIGQEKAAFLHIKDIFLAVESDDLEKPDISPPSISECLHEGQEVIVQVIKDPIKTKGARLTTQLSISSRDLVFMPGIKHIGVSLKIEDEVERARLRELLEFDSEKDEGGFIIRTVAEGVTSLKENKKYLKKLWQVIKERSKMAKCGEIIYADFALVLRTLRDLVRPNIEKVRIDSLGAYNKAINFANEFIPDLIDKIELYLGERAIFDIYGIEDEIQKALSRKLLLKSGGHLVFDQTEAMSTIDVNTGSFVGTKNLDETIFRTNLEAAVSISRQLRLRNLGGIIIIDFIDMLSDVHRAQVMKTLEKELSYDYAKTTISEFSALGLVQMTRKRTRESLEHCLCEDCPICMGRGTIRTAETVCYEIFREIIRLSKLSDSNNLLVLASQGVVDLMLDEESDSVLHLGDKIHKTIRFQAEPLFTQEQYDVVML